LIFFPWVWDVLLFILLLNGATQRLPDQGPTVDPFFYMFSTKKGQGEWVMRYQKADGYDFCLKRIPYIVI